MTVNSKEFLKDLAQANNLMGGGSAAALVAGIAASLSHKVLENELNQGRHPGKEKEIGKFLLDLKTTMEDLDAIILEDPKALRFLIQAYKLPKSSQEENDIRKKKIREGIEEAAEPQMKILLSIENLLKIYDYIISLNPQGEIVTNLEESNHFAKASVEVARIGLITNYKYFEDAELRESKLRKVEEKTTYCREKIRENIGRINNYLETSQWKSF